MGVGKQKPAMAAKRIKGQSSKKAHVKAPKRRNNAKIIHARRENAAVADAKRASTDDSKQEESTSLTPWQKHNEKVEQKRKVREMLNYKKAERQAIKKKTIEGDEESIRKSLVEEINTLKSDFSFGGASARPLSTTAEEEEAMTDETGA